MFFVYELKNDICVSPKTARFDFLDVLDYKIQQMYVNKVILDVGLVIALYDIIHVGNSFILPVDGSTVTPVQFRLIIFRPSISSLVTGRIKDCSDEGIQVSLEFFDDIFIPAESLQSPSRFEKIEQAWIWEYTSDDGSKHDLILDVGEQVQFRVCSEKFSQSPPLNNPIQGNQQHVPYSIIGSMSEPGLGALSWWPE